MKRDPVKNPEHLTDVIDDLIRSHSAETNLDNLYLRNYYSRPVVQLNDMARTVLELALDSTVIDTGWNLTREVVDTAVATIARPLQGIIMPVGAENEMQRACRVVSRLSDGIDETSDFETISQRVFIDGALTHVGCLRGVVVGNEIRATRVEPGNIFTLPEEKDSPRHYYVTTILPRSAVIEEHGNKRRDLEDAKEFHSEVIPGVDPITTEYADTLRVCEMWRLPVGGKGGRYIKTVGPIVLANDPYDIEWPPLAFFSWSFKHRGFGGKPLASIVAPYHMQTNQAIDKLNRSFEVAVPHVVAEEDSLLTKHSDEAYTLVEYQSGKAAPRIEKTEPASNQLIEWVPQIRARCFAECGVSEMIASSQRPNGLNSEPSQLAWVDIANIRSEHPARRWQSFYKQWMRVKLGLASTLYRKEGARIRSPGSRIIEEVRWPVDLREGKYEYRVAVKSALSLTVSGRMQELESLRKLLPTQLTEADVARYLGLTDVEKASDRANAEMDLVEQMIDLALVEGEGQIPSEIMGTTGLESLIRVGRQAYMMALVKNNYPQANIELLHRMIQAAQKMLVPPAAPIPPPAPQLPPVDATGGPIPITPPVPPISLGGPPVSPQPPVVG